MLLEYATTRERAKPRIALFLTLTYDDDHVPIVASREGVPLFSLRRKDLQDFFKRFRQRLKRAGDDRKVRYYYAGEYGDNTFRPHYHVILYGFDLDDFPDAYLYSHDNLLNTDLYESPKLDFIWSNGSVRFSLANYSTFCYVGRYILKKQFGLSSYHDYDNRSPPFNGMSLKPGIGSDYFDDVDFDRVSLSDGVDVHSVAVPRIVLERLKDSDPELYESIKAFRRELNSNRSQLMAQQTSKPWLQYLRDSERVYLNRSKCLSFRGKI